MHPADLADIVEELGPAEREAIFETIDSEVAADALSEVDPKMQASILESLEPEKAADIVEEMSPDEAADVLAELEDETSEEILDEMESEPKTEVQELLEFEEDTAGGMMNTEYVALHENATVADAHGGAARQRGPARDAQHAVPGGRRRQAGGRPSRWPRLFVAAAVGARCKDLAADTLIQAAVDEKQDRVTELFDKYNLLTLPVVDEDGKLAGVITADDIISVLRQQVADAETPAAGSATTSRSSSPSSARASSPPWWTTTPAASSPTPPRARVRLPAAVDAAAHHRGAHHHPGDVLAHGRGDRQGTFRSDPRRVRPAHHVPDDGRCWCWPTSPT